MSMTYEEPVPTPEIDFSDEAPSPRSRRLRWVAAGLALVLAAGAGLGFVVGGNSSTPTPHSGAARSPSPYALNNDSAPSLAGAYSDDPRTAFLALFGYHNWLYEHPTLADVGKYTVVDSPAYQGELTNLSYLVKRHAHFPDSQGGYDGDIEYVRVSQQPQPLAALGKELSRGGHRAYGPAVVVVVQHELLTSIYSPIGQPLQIGQQAGEEANSYSLSQGLDGQWRIYSVVALHPAGGPKALEGSG